MVNSQVLLAYLGIPIYPPDTWDCIAKLVCAVYRHMVHAAVTRQEVS